MDNEEKYPEIRSKLKNLEQVKAGDDFVNKLHMKIVEVEGEKRHEHEARFDEHRGGFLKNLFGNMQYPWLAPAVGFTVLIFFVFYITYLNKTTSEKDQQLLSTRKLEDTGQNNNDINKNPNVQQEPYISSEHDKTFSDKEKQAGKDIASDLKTEPNGSKPSTSENNKRLTDRDEFKNYKEESKTFVSPKKLEEEIETPSPETESKAPGVSLDKIDKDKEGADKQKESSESVNDGGILNLKKSDTQMKAPGDSEIARGRADEDEAKGKKLKEKMNKINRSSLEKIRDEVLK